MKRMTETGKWADRWFRSLAPDHKCLWIYLLDNCDQCGVIEPDYELIEFIIGSTFDWGCLESVFSGRLVRLDDHKWWIPKFIRFQNGKLSPDCKPHQHIIGLLEKHGLSGRYRTLEENGYKGLEEAQTLLPILAHTPTPKNGLQRQPDAPTATPTKQPKLTAVYFDTFWMEWPRSDRKTDKAKCLKYWQVHGLDNLWDAIHKGLEAWKVSESWTSDEGKYIPMPYTWLNNARWETPPAQAQLPPPTAKKEPSKKEQFDRAVGDLVERLWAVRKNYDEFTRQCQVGNDKYRDLGVNQDGHDVVYEAVDIVRFRQEAERRKAESEET